MDPYLIAAPANLLRPLLDILATDPRVAVMSVTSDTSGNPRRLVVAMSADLAQALGAVLGDRALIEPDYEIHPSSRE